MVSFLNLAACHSETPVLRSVHYQLRFVLYLRIKAMQTDAGIGIGKLPLDLDRNLIASGCPSLAFFFQGSEVCKPAVEALALHG